MNFANSNCSYLSEPPPLQLCSGTIAIRPLGKWASENGFTGYLDQVNRYGKTHLNLGEPFPGRGTLDCVYWKGGAERQPARIRCALLLGYRCDITSCFNLLVDVPAIALP